MALTGSRALTPAKPAWMSGVSFAPDKVMRPVVFLILALILASLAQAGPRPLTNREIILMLRTGFSSESVLAEIVQRHVAEPLDPATKKSLSQLGATQPLIAALESNAFAATSAEMVAPKAPVTRPAGPPAIATPPPARVGAAPVPNEHAIMKAMHGKLVLCRDGVVSQSDDSVLENKKLIALYFSAHWCGPCRRFTPELVDFYNQVEPQHPEFEIIFVSSDHSRFNWETYMRDMRMPWLAIDYDRVAELGPLRALSGDGIPSLVLLDANGRVLSSTYEGGKRLGPEKVLQDLQRIFASGANALAQLP
jgi:nucleoredoxin